MLQDDAFLRLQDFCMRKDGSFVYTPLCAYVFLLWQDVILITYDADDMHFAIYYRKDLTSLNDSAAISS